MASVDSWFPSPCGVRRVRDGSLIYVPKEGFMTFVSVPLRGKEGAGLDFVNCNLTGVNFVSVPLRGKEGAGLAARVTVCRKA